MKQFRETSDYINVAHIGADINNSKKVYATDLVLVLQTLTDMQTQPLSPNISDINGDNKIGIEEAEHILHFICSQTYE